MLDTNAVTSLLKRRLTLSARLRAHRPTDFGLPVIAAHELFHGACKSQERVENLAIVEALQFEVLELDKEDARQAGEIRAALAARDKPIGPRDVLIAGKAKARDLILITHNTLEFARVDGLKIEDWQIQP